MSFSRRKFMKAGVVATAFAFFPIKSAFGQKGSQGQDGIMSEGPRLSPSSRNKLEQLNYYDESSFAPYVNTQFSVYLNPSSTRSLNLTEVRDYLKTLPKSLRQSAESSVRTECFSLLLTAPQGNTFTQDTYLIEHEALGAFYLFLVPVSQPGKGPQDYYEAVVCRDGQQQFWSTSDSVKETNPASAPVPQARATEGLAIENSAGMRKTEQDVFYFQPQKLKPAEASTPKEEPGAAGRRAAAELTLSQAPDIGGLTLGMTLEQVLALFPRARKDAEVRARLAKPADAFGEFVLIIHPGKYSSEKRADRVNQIIFTFLDGQVSTLYVGYDGPVWEHVDQFVAQFSEEKGLPGADSWDAYSGMDTQLKTLKGKEFEVSLFACGNSVNVNYVQMRDLLAQQKLEKRRAEANETNDTAS